jgi:hypothetical protein
LRFVALMAPTSDFAGLAAVRTLTPVAPYLPLDR